jgi:TRAP-type C4-dicarboxylate transport system permease small subunit
MKRLHSNIERLLELIVIVLMVFMAVEVLLGVTYRKFGESLVWYDEIASVTLAWLTYYGAALAALKGAHIGVPEIVRLLPRGARVALVYVAEAVVLVFLAILTYSGWMVLGVLATDTLVSLPDVPVSYTQSVIPIGSALFLIAELLHIPEALAAARAEPGSTHGARGAA